LSNALKFTNEGGNVDINLNIMDVQNSLMQPGQSMSNQIAKHIDNISRNQSSSPNSSQGQIMDRSQTPSDQF
jgi:hypothetical protein